MDPNNFQQTAPTGAPAYNNAVNSSNGHRKIGPTIAVLVIVLVLIVAALYLFASRLSTEEAANLDTNIALDCFDQDCADAPGQPVQPITNQADDVQSLEDDLNSATNGLDSQNF